MIFGSLDCNHVRVRYSENLFLFLLSAFASLRENIRLDRDLSDRV